MALRRQTILALVLALAAAGGLAWRARRGAGPDPAAELARLVPGHRALLARTSLPLPHAPYDPAEPAAGPAEREAIYARLLGAKVAGVPGAGAALAIFYAVRREAGDAERALAEAADPVDRGAVLLALDRPAEALEEFARALADRPTDPAALFDRPLALEALLLDGQAADAWEALLAADAAGGWVDEARARIASLRAPGEPAQASLEERKREVAAALREPRPDGLDAARQVATSLADAGDRLFLREVEYLERLDEAGWRRRGAVLRRLAEVQDEVLAGRDRDDALTGLAATDEPLIGVRALQYAAYGALVRGDRAAGDRWLAALRERCRRLACAEELALVESDLGILEQREGDYAAALSAFERADSLLPEIYATRRSELDTRRADVELRGGAADQAARLLARAIRTQRRRHGADLARALHLRGNAEDALDRTEVALAYWSESAREAREQRQAAAELRAIQAKARALARSGRRAEGIGLLEQVLGRLRQTDLESLSCEALADLAQLEGDEGQLERARRTAEEAVELARRQYPLLLAYALESRALVAWREGDGAAAANALREAVALDEGRAADAPGELAALGVRGAVASRRMLLALVLGEAGHPAEAFAAFAAGPAAGLAPDECRIGLGHVRGQLFAVATGATGPTFVTRPMADLDWRAALQHADSAELLGPILGSAPCLGASRRVSVLDVPGSPAAPIAAALRRRFPELLVGITFRPDGRWPVPRMIERALVVYDPAPGGAVSLPVLPNAAREADIVASSFVETERLTGDQATVDAVRRRGSEADLLHFAVHGVSRLHGGAASHLVLTGEPGRLRVVDILALDLRSRKPLVVLSACHAGGSPGRVEYDGAGLPWAFLRAGASAVLANEGELDDGYAVGFTRRFVDRLAAGLPVGEAAAAAENEIARRGSLSASRFVLYF